MEEGTTLGEAISEVISSCLVTRSGKSSVMVCWDGKLRSTDDFFAISNDYSSINTRCLNLHFDGRRRNQSLKMRIRDKDRCLPTYEATFTPSWYR